MGVNNNGMLFHFSVNKCPLLLVSYELKVSTVVVSLANQLAQPGIFTSAGVYTLIWGNNYDLLFHFAFNNSLFGGEQILDFLCL